ncbi:MAG: hypothetical protein IIU63_03110, partial [Clostridia bacterium]|nr:hypothetical protein [Clostridia bacterium]
MIDISKKTIAINGNDVWHEYDRHSKIDAEQSRQQIAFTPETMKEAIEAIYEPDVVESVFADPNNPTQRQSFAYAKKSPDGHYVVVEAVGGKRNPNIVPVMILQFSETKWNRMVADGKTLGELLYENDSKLRISLDVDFNKKNRVTAAQFASSEAIANTPRSPRSNISITENEPIVKQNAKNFLENRVSGDDLLNAQDLISDVRDLGAEVDERGYITLYHRTSASSAAAIRSTGMMVAKEDGLFFSTKENGQNVGYGDTVVTFKIPAEKLVLDDVFDDEAHLRYPLDKPGRVSVKEYLAKTTGNMVRRSRAATGEVVTLSKGQIAALQANYHGEKVFVKKDVTTALKGIEALQGLPAEVRNDFINRVWTGYNKHLHQQGFERFTEVIWHHIHAAVLQENGFEMTEAEIAKMDEQIVNALHQIVASGKQSIKAKLESATSTEGYRKQANYWREEHTRTVERNKLLGRVKFEVEKLANMKAGRYVNAANYKNQSFAGAITELARMNWRGGLVRDQKIRERFAELDVWYSKENPLYKGDGNGNELFRQDIKDALSALGNAQNGALTNDDLLAAETVIKYFAHEIEAHNTVYKDGKRVDAMPEAKRYVENVARAKEIAVKCGIWQRLTRSGFARMVADPAMLMRQADGYLDGFFTEQYEQLRQGTIDAAVLERELAEDFEKFWDEHKAYGKRYNNATVTFDGKELPLQEAISLYMTMKREHAFAGLAGAGFEIDGKDATENVSDGFVELVEKLKTAEYNKLPPEELLTLTKEGHARIEQAALEKAVAEKRKALFDQFTDEDKALISLMEKTLEQCRDVKVRIDEIVQGYSNVTGGYYFPIKRTGLAENVDAFTGFEGDRVSNLSINKDTVKNAHKLLIEPAHIVFMRHVKAISLYHGLGVFTDNFNRLFNLNTVENVNNPTTVRTALGQSNKYAKEMLTYFKELKQDVEGISKKRHTEKFYNDAVAYIRSAYATYQLGFNPKVWITQLSSLVAATNILDADALTKGLKVSGKDVDEYCRLAWLRNNDNAAAMA